MLSGDRSRTAGVAGRFVWLIFTLFAVIVDCVVCIPVLDAVRHQGCEIPGESTRGTCKKENDCAAYGSIVNDANLNFDDRNKFIERVQCGNRDGTMVCCPEGSYQTTVKQEEGTEEQCGFQAYSFRIRGGSIADIDEFPWTAMLLSQDRKLFDIIIWVNPVI